nr:hypothetical protein BaRGS_025561 [Batillaria attramentaria]
MSRTGRGRPRTVSAKFRSRPLGADIYPTLGNSDIDREKAYFRVHPRTLVAPQLLKRITSTLPPALTGEKYRLDCGCAISLHRDFLFPVIVTDHDVHSRLCAVKRGPAKTPSAGRSSTSREELHSQGSLPTGMEDGRGVEAGHGTLGVEEPEEEEVSMSPADMRVTVRYNTPSPEQKGVFIT